MVHFGRMPRAVGDRAMRRGMRAVALALLTGSALALAACGQAGDAASAAGAPAPARPGQNAAGQAKTQTVDLIGKIDADSDAPGTFTGVEGWPAAAPSEIHLSAGARVVLTIKEYDDMMTPLPEGSPYTDVMGGTATVNGEPLTKVDNMKIAHTLTIPTLGINIPLPVASEDGPTVVQFTFTAPGPGTYQWLCLTPCGDGHMGMGGAMMTNGWMRGHVIVS